jgi:hypothetical protein
MVKISDSGQKRNIFFGAHTRATSNLWKANCPFGCLPSMTRFFFRLLLQRLLEEDARERDEYYSALETITKKIRAISGSQVGRTGFSRFRSKPAVRGQSFFHVSVFWETAAAFHLALDMIN